MSELLETRDIHQGKLQAASGGSLRGLVLERAGGAGITFYWNLEDAMVGPRCWTWAFVGWFVLLGFSLASG